jgi:hypothetical protein
VFTSAPDVLAKGPRQKRWITKYVKEIAKPVDRLRFIGSFAALRMTAWWTFILNPSPILAAL